ncbi:MAG TPA: hypothetical protein DCE42_29230 [Myxococcales bacterium]|nr:hypothetical protein [Deltaproteobacteria bacterium]MBU53473.1 hypothetical protein [Deltaproteobacteria bacterium]HAA58882.1 hypothetical protein [Myxococcales bacterium]|tara:strand:+ start:3232 stop:3531 length:300 start_codon:yes stop_codon:yes gene_type:complete
MLPVPLLIGIGLGVSAFIASAKDGAIKSQQREREEAQRQYDAELRRQQEYARSHVIQELQQRVEEIDRILERHPNLSRRARRKLTDLADDWWERSRVDS